VLIKMYDFYTFWVANLWGSEFLALFGTGLIFALIGVFGKWSYNLLVIMLLLYFFVFGATFYGFIVWFFGLVGAIAYFYYVLSKKWGQ